MGCCVSHSSDRNIGFYIHTVKVKDVKPIPQSEIEEFKRKYVSNIYLHPEDEGFKERSEKANEIMFKRWDWLQKNIETYVNMLRVKGFTDEQIQDCLDGKRPLSFKTVQLHKEFCHDLKELGIKLEKELGFKNVWFAQVGSAVPGYSSNPHKGLVDVPSKITDPDSSDVDIVLIAEGIKEWVEKSRKEGKKVKEYPCTVDRDGKKEDCRYGNRQLAEISQHLVEWEQKWSKKLGGGVQITFQDGNPIFPPWELPVPIEYYD
jgi:hypothetical protein